MTSKPNGFGIMVLFYNIIAYSWIFRQRLNLHWIALKFKILMTSRPTPCPARGPAPWTPVNASHKRLVCSLRSQLFEPPMLKIFLSLCFGSVRVFEMRAGDKSSMFINLWSQFCCCLRSQPLGFQIFVCIGLSVKPVYRLLEQRQGM